MSFLSKRMTGSEMSRHSAQMLVLWEEKTIALTLEQKLNVSNDIMGRTGEEGCKHAIILMADSARVMTPIAQERRKVERNPRFAHLLRKKQYKTVLSKDKSLQYRYFKYRAWRLTQGSPGQKEIFANRPSQIGKIGHRGLAQRSWTWGLSAFTGGREQGKPIPGTYSLTGVIEGDSAGYVKQNRLGYISAIMPAGWESQVVEKAGNKAMGQARNRMERDWGRAVQRNTTAAHRTLKDFFKATL